MGRSEEVKALLASLGVIGAPPLSRETSPDMVAVVAPEPPSLGAPAAPYIAPVSAATITVSSEMLERVLTRLERVEGVLEDVRDAVVLLARATQPPQRAPRLELEEAPTVRSDDSYDAPSGANLGDYLGVGSLDLRQPPPMEVEDGE